MLAAMRVVIVEPDAIIIIGPLNRAAAGGIVLRRGQGESGAAAQTKDGLHQAFAKAFLADDPGAIAILHRTRDYLGSGSSFTVDQNHERHRFGAAIFRAIGLLRV